MTTTSQSEINPKDIIDPDAVYSEWSTSETAGKIRTVADLGQMELQNFPEVWHKKYKDRYGHIQWNLIHACVMSYIQLYRIRSGVPIMPSPIARGWVRQDKASDYSDHYVSLLQDGKIDKPSYAGDFFPKQGGCCKLFDMMRSSNVITKLGIYWGTSPHPMIHMGLVPGERRNTGAMKIWACEQDEHGNQTYFSMIREYAEFMRVLNKVYVYDKS